MNERALTIRIPVGLYEQIRARAEAEDRSMAQLIRRACRVYLDQARGCADGAGRLDGASSVPAEGASGPVRGAAEGGSRFRLKALAGSTLVRFEPGASFDLETLNPGEFVVANVEAHGWDVYLGYRLAGVS